jgi:hypothetical protein
MIEKFMKIYTIQREINSIFNSKSILPTGKITIKRIY